MKYLKRYTESKNHGRFMGYHCSDNPNLKTEISDMNNLGQPDYWEWHEYVLESIKDKYPESKNYLKRIRHWNGNKFIGEEIGYDENLTKEICKFLKKLQIKGIFITEDKPNNRWGKYCYEVYFTKTEFDKIQDFKMLEDEGHEYSFLYPYQIDPIFKKF